MLVPTRQRFAGLLRTVESVFATATTGRVEVLVRADDDDQETLAHLPELDRPNVHVIIGPRLFGYGSLYAFYSELAAVADGDWIAIGNDDAWFEGVGWDAQLAALPLGGLIVHPEWVRASPEVAYQFLEGGPFPIVPLDCWKKFDREDLPSPIDTGLDELLRKQHGWRSHFLAGLTIVHERDEDFMIRRQPSLHSQKTS